MMMVMVWDGGGVWEDGVGLVGVCIESCQIALTEIHGRL